MKLDFKFWWIDDDFDKAVNMEKSVSSWIQLVLTDVALLIQNTAKMPWYAPVLTWHLRWSITTDFNRIQQWMVVVWSDAPYARRREFENKLHPQNLLYLHRAWRDNETRVWEIIKNDLSKELN